MYKPKPCCLGCKSAIIFDVPRIVRFGTPRWMTTFVHLPCMMSSFLRFTGSRISCAPHDRHKSGSHSRFRLKHSHLSYSRQILPLAAQRQPRNLRGQDGGQAQVFSHTMCWRAHSHGSVWSQGPSCAHGTKGCRLSWSRVTCVPVFSSPSQRFLRLGCTFWACSSLRSNCEGSSRDSGRLVMSFWKICGNPQRPTLLCSCSALPRHRPCP